MDKLLELLKDGHARTIFQISEELNTTVPDIERKLEYMEHMGIIRKVKPENCSCSGCSGCSTHGKDFTCAKMWEVV